MMYSFKTINTSLKVRQKINILHPRPRADRASLGVMPPRGAVLTPKEDDLEVKLVPQRLIKERLKVALGLHHALAR